MTLDEKLKELKDLCDKATPGPWHFDCGNGEVESDHDKHERISVVCRADVLERKQWWTETLGNEDNLYVDPNCDMEYVAAANPSQLSSLLRIIEIQKAALETISEMRINEKGSYCADIGARVTKIACIGSYANDALAECEKIAGEM